MWNLLENLREENFTIVSRIGMFLLALVIEELEN